MGLADKVNIVVRALSGGMKRKLSLGIALIGDSKVVQFFKEDFFPFFFSLNVLFLVLLFIFCRLLFLMNLLVEWTHTRCD